MNQAYYFVLLVASLLITVPSCNAANETNTTTAVTEEATTVMMNSTKTGAAVAMSTVAMTTTNSEEQTTVTIKPREEEVTEPDSVCNVSAAPYGITPKSGAVGTTAEGVRNDTTSKYAMMRTCNVTLTCLPAGTWDIAEICGQYMCIEKGVWGPNCTSACGGGCSNQSCNGEGYCTDPVTGMRVSNCNSGYTGDRCNEPICDSNCNGGGTCLAPNFCGNCPKHFEHGPFCRNLRTHGLIRGALPALFILCVIVTALSLGSKYYMRNKLKEY